MRIPLCALALLFACGLASAQHQHGAGATAEAPPVRLLEGLGGFSLPVTTSVPEAQKFFDQGMILVYGFNHDEAARSFRRAAELDPRMAMAWWGLALALGPNYNEATISPERMRGAHEAVQTGLRVAAEAKAPDHERAYLETLARRFSADPAADQPKLWAGYREAARDLLRRYPDDPEAATLYADASMILNAWRLFRPDGSPAEGTEEIISVLEEVMRRDPEHIGAHHLYIHAVEASRTPERALLSADRLAALSPAAGHLVHMPAHIYMRTGDYERAARSNEWAAKADEVYLDEGGLRGIYSAAYYSHNLHFLAAAHSMQGNYAEAERAARRLERNVTPYLKEMPFFESFLPTRTLVAARFGRWREVTETPEPPATTPITNALWHWARGMALAATGRPAEAEAALKVFRAKSETIPPAAGYGQNTARDVLRIGEHFLNARLASARGDRAWSIEHLRRAVEAEDALAYDEPPGWYHPLSRESLGGALLLAGRAAEAEQVFREDLRRNRRNGRSLFGLSEALKAQGKVHEAALVRREFERAWKNADTRLRIEDL
ncbi:MAG TPA: tetratricopeptide repeat protein [Pyrinomonadaceae bacterium]|nr:tetratricopeptide repeat protein [Pyrinomonadaceae bacterium]